jgi:hypothetical protein
MYWFRHGNPVEFLPWLGVMALSALGGWLLATHAFRLERRERLVAGVGLGIFLYVWLINLVGRWLTPVLAFTFPAVMVLLIGVAFAWKGARPLLDWRDLQVWSLILAGATMLWLFILMGKGLGVFDEYKNISLISTIATGEIPPHYFQSSSVYYSYHYAFHLFGASLMRLGGLFPWSAYDLSKALIGAYGILLAYLLGKRMIPHPYGGTIAALIFLFADGTRYLLLLLPPAWLIQLNPLITLQGNSALIGVGFSRALVRPWLLEGGPPYAFAFAYTNGILAWPRFVAIQAGPSSFGLAVMLLIWLLSSYEKRRASLALMAVLFSVWALAWESSYAMAGIAGVLLLVYGFWKREALKRYLPGTVALLISAPISLLQGGTITQMASRLISGATSNNLGTTAATTLGFALRWPPAIISAHLGTLRLTSPLELLVAFFELGPVVLFIPWITSWTWKRFRQGDWITGLMVVSAWLGFFFPIFVSYKADRDITRFTAHALLVWTFVLVFLLGSWPQRWSLFLRNAAVIALALMTFGGIVIAGTALTAATQVVLPDKITELDTRVAARYWDALPRGSEIFDPEEWRATALTGRLTRATIPYEVDELLPEWRSLRDNPTTGGMIASKYQLVYIDDKWWDGLSPESRASLTEPCVRTVAEFWDDGHVHFRRLVDISACHP